jgi:hypothetical protein
MLADDKTYLYFTDYWFLLRYSVIIYKFTQGNLGAKKNRKLRHWRPTARSLIDFQKCLVVSSLNICILTFNSPAKQWQLWPMTRDLYKKKMYQLCCNQFWHRVSGTLEIFFFVLVSFNILSLLFILFWKLKVKFKSAKIMTFSFFFQQLHRIWHRLRDSVQQKMWYWSRDKPFMVNKMVGTSKSQT